MTLDELDWARGVWTGPHNQQSRPPQPPAHRFGLDRASNLINPRNWPTVICYICFFVLTASSDGGTDERRNAFGFALDMLSPL